MRFVRCPSMPGRRWRVRAGCCSSPGGWRRKVLAPGAVRGRDAQGALAASRLRRSLHTPSPWTAVRLAEQLGGPLLDAARSGAAREALFSAVLRQVDEPGVLTIVAIEDLHWAEEATLDLLRHLGRRLRHATTMVSCRTRRATSRSPPVTPCSGGLPGSAPAHGSPYRRPHSSEARLIPGSCARCAQAHSTPSMPSSPPGFSLPTGRPYVSATS